MTELNISKKCDWCQGTGLIKNEEGATITCSSCIGSGKETLHTINITELDTKINDIQEKSADTNDKVNDIKEKVDEVKETVDKILELVEKLGG